MSLTCDQNKLRVALFGSSLGTTIEYVLRNDLLSPFVSHIVLTDTVTNSALNTLKREHTELSTISASIFTNEGRDRFEDQYREFWSSEQSKPHVIFLLGWNYILSDDLLAFYSSNNILVVNLHPALPSSYVGGDAVSRLYQDLQNDKLRENLTGSIVHIVTGDLDRGLVLDMSKIIVNKDSISSEAEFRALIKDYEKPLVLNSFNFLINEYRSNNLSNLLTKATPKYVPYYRGKVREVIDIDYGLLLLNASNRISAFDRHLTVVPDKGALLNSMSAWWFNNTRHIIDNHYLYSSGSHMIARKCTTPIMLEIVVRAYMTGSSETSVWTKYNNGERNMYGLLFRDGYSKNEPLDEIVITPTTKGVIDVPITRDEIVEKGYLSRAQTDFIFKKATELFKYGAKVARERGLILVDTKYEFGFCNNEIILMDELHTCDSSRYWKADSYDELVSQGKEPEKFDKDCIRDYVKKTYSSEEIKTRGSFDIPPEIVEKVNNVYKTYHRMLTGYDIPSGSTCDAQTRGDIETLVTNYLKNKHNEIVVILAGSVSDKEHVEKIKRELASQNIFSIEYYKSAHKNTLDVMNILKMYNKDIDPLIKRKIVFVTVAGRSNALSGVVASNVKYPVIACPPFKDKMDMFTNINSSLQCPSKVPVLTVLEPQNVAISIRYMFDNGK